MSAFIPHTPTAARADDVITAQDTRLPALSVRDFRERLRVDDSVSQARTRALLEQAQMTIDAQLQDWLTRQTALNAQQSLQYQLAVYHLAKGYELEHYRDADSSDFAHRRQSGLDKRIDVAHQRSRELLRLLTGRARTTIALI